MTNSIYDWATTAASNTATLNGITLDGSVMTVPQIDNAFRDEQAQLAMFRADITGTITAGGSANALTVTANSGFTSHANGRMVAFIAASDNTTAATLAVNGLSALSVRKMSSSGDTALSGGEIQAGGVYLAVYNSALNSAAGGWLLINPTGVLTDLVTTADGAFFGANADTDYTLGRNDNDGYLEIQGGNDATGGKWRGYGGGHATQAKDIEYYSNNSLVYWYDFSAGQHQFNNTVYLANRVYLGQSSTFSPGQGNNTQGAAFDSTNGGFYANGNGVAHGLGRCQDGTVVLFASGGTAQASMSISGTTGSYNTFFGSHWSQLADGSKPDILRGTICESINQMCEWPDEAPEERLPRFKISDVQGSRSVYGVFAWWDDDWTATNDAHIGALGAYVVRIAAGVTVQRGDLIESNGDGCGRVQAHDIMGPNTVAKVTSTVVAETYPDGSYLVPCTLHCG